VSAPGSEGCGLHVVLFEPEIPANAGNVMRLAANTGARLHLVGPLGFVLDDARLRRAGLDYRDRACVTEHADWAAFRAAHPELRLWAFTTRASRAPDTAGFRRGDGLLFGPESRGLPAERLADAHGRLRLPMLEGSRSLNLSNAVAVGVYEAWRQVGW
jgi:tRNA (cytidine(34)-2'-O)-methyltransferase